MVKKIYGMGNPLLDISCEVEAELLTQYDLKPANATLAEEKHLPLYKDLSERSGTQFIPGGATLNSIRVARWMLQAPLCSFSGCIGKDKFGAIMRDSSEKEGLNVPFMETEDQPTGTCAVLITGKERSLVANLAAANCFKVEHIDTEPVKKAIHEAEIFYISGFFLTVCVPAILSVAKHAAETNKIFCMNLSAPFVVQFFKGQLDEVMPYIDILFSNDDEARMFSTSSAFETEDLGVIAKKAAALPKVNSKRPRLVIFTNGSKSTVVGTSDSVTEYPVDPIASDKIIDTNGAGDAFVGGFLSQMANDKPIETCVKAGHYAAGVIIQHSGCTFPATPTFC